MKDVKTEVYEALRSATVEAEPIIKKLGDAEADISGGKFSEEYTRDYLKPKRDELQKQVKAACDSAMKDAQAIVDRFKEETQAALQLNPEALTADINLLNCAVPLVERDLCAILDRVKGNRTMETLTHRYAEMNGVKLPQAYVYTGDAEARQAEITADGMADVAKRYTTRYMGTADGLDMLNRFFQVGA